MVLAILLFIGAFVITNGTLAIAASSKRIQSKGFIVAFDTFLIVIMVLAGVALL